ncbi:GNAT family N-acetyltransferase [Hymenobacter arizonensis]|uniref:Protein N-acetyltransferase, RimJ/RimL family n=1 Tax=Hymenobacter arizonensis TaxID=1227077 RepID=A0A1I6BQF5_HYMAR|nr:GNAT family protein [Hymenobacter arizonensis]SFQ83166.1 Protein N-acetyltransferase, RimJ/RimL family [Hymenobacter arizonensis]
MTLHTARLQLRELSWADLSAVHQLHSLPEVDAFNTLGLPASVAATERLLAGWLAQQRAVPRTSYLFCAQRADSAAFVGLLALNLGKPQFHNGEVWYKLLPGHWGQGLATEALTELLRFGFDDLRLHRIEAGCAVGNAASIRVLEKAGMTREGRKRQVLPIRGQWVDNFWFAILETDR